MDTENDIPLPYDDPPTAAPEDNKSSLANRIGSNRLYLLADSAAALHGRLGKVLHGGRLGKRKADAAQLDSPTEQDIDIEEDESLSERRPNAFLLQGEPISHLPTARMFAYTSHFEVKPMGLEWVDDSTCVLVFETPSLARRARSSLRKDEDEDEDLDGFVDAKPVPVTLWPIEDRLSKVLGQSEGLKGVIRMRWAKVGDVKKKGARNESQFYKKHGEQAGKEGLDPYGYLQQQGNKRRRINGEEKDNAIATRAQLDAELDSFLDDRKQAELSHRSSDTTVYSETTSARDRPQSQLPRRSREKNKNSYGHEKDQRDSGRRGRRKDVEIPSKDSLDDELDRFLKERDAS